MTSLNAAMFVLANTSLFWQLEIILFSDTVHVKMQLNFNHCRAKKIDGHL